MLYLIDPVPTNFYGYGSVSETHKLYWYINYSYRKERFCLRDRYPVCYSEIKKEEKAICNNVKRIEINHGKK